MYTYIAKRLLVAIPTLLIISVFVFSLQKLLPGDPILAMAGEERDPQVIEYLREKYRLNDPVPYQYVSWLGSVLQGDLGISLRTNQPVLELVAEKLPVTIQLAIMIDATGRNAAFTGEKCIDWAGHLVAENVSVAGNMSTDDAPIGTRSSFLDGN